MMLSILFALATFHAMAADQPLNGIESSYTIYVYPPHHPLDWTSPRTALKSTAENLIHAGLTLNSLVHFRSDFGDEGTMSSEFNSGIGHTLNHFHCRLENGVLWDKWASLSGQEYPVVDDRLMNQWRIGFGVLLYNYVDGYIIAGEENWKRITYYSGEVANGEQVRPRYIQLEINSEQCEAAKKMEEFFESFHYAPNAPIEQLEARSPENTLYFTSSIDPFDSYEQRMQTGHGNIGGGCAPFAAALLKVTGRYDQQLEPIWRTPVTVSEKLVGGIEDPFSHQIRRVDLTEILFSPLGDHWDYSAEGYRNYHLNLYDPQKIWGFTGNVLECLGAHRCDSQARKFLTAHKGQLSAGATETFRDSYEVLAAPGEPTDENGYKRIHVAQPVDGFVWRQ
jgi:hypothetical protein